ncbi:MAG: hypothetical protein KDN20_09970, partial [Verrucomicrobiae bacterium]|nr:hypothetical protein [Verrucomicrobiae bacterium]
TLQKAIAAAEGTFQAKEEQLTGKRGRASHLERLIQAIPLVTELKQIDGDLAEITLPELPSDFPERVRKAQGELAEAQTRHGVQGTALAGKRRQLDDIAPYQSIVDDAPDLDALHQGIARHWEDLDTLANNEEALRQLRQRHETQLKDLGLDSTEALTAMPDLSLGDLAALEDLAESLASREQHRAQAETDLAQTVEELTDEKDKLVHLGDAQVTPAILELESRINAHNQESRIAATQIDERNQKAIDLKQTAQHLGLANRDAEEIRKLPVPATALLQEFKQEHDALTAKRDEQQKKLDQLNSKIIEKKADIEQTSGNIAVFTDEDLFRVRGERDARWTELATKLKHGTAAGAGEVDTLSEGIQKSDEIADALRDHAEILGKLATLNHDLTRLTNQRDHEKGIFDRFTGELTKWNERWIEKSRFLDDRDFLPAELIEWRAQWLNWREMDNQLDVLDEKIAVHRQTEMALLEELRQHFENPDATYGVLSRQLTDAISDANTAKGERKVLSESIARLTKKQARQETALAEATEKLENTRKDWARMLADQRLDVSGSTKAVLASLKARRDARITHQKIEDGTKGLSELAERIADFQKRLNEQRQKHLPDSPELDPRNPELTENRLSKVLADARERQTRHATLKEEIAELEADLQAKQGTIAAAEREIDTLVAEAKLDSADGLSAAISQFEKRQGLSKQRATSHRTLVNLAGSLSIEDFIAEAEAGEGEPLQDELNRLNPEIKLLQQERDEARDALGKEIEQRTELETAKDGAINAKQLAANALAKIVTDSERFIRLQHAIAFLKAQVEAYREKSQGPMIKKTSEFFTTLTNGSFTGVAAQADDRDPSRVNLVALRQNPDNPDGIPGTLHTAALSEGTRDQLYLALRLAAIDIHLENHAPMPLILDDILMTFDDERAESVFKVLKTLSKKTQVLIFTHHQHIAELARDFVPDDHLLNLPSR